MSTDKTKAVLYVEIKMFPFRINYVKICILSEMRQEFLPRHSSVRFPPLLVTEASWGEGSGLTNRNHDWLLFYLEGFSDASIRVVSKETRISIKL